MNYKNHFTIETGKMQVSRPCAVVSVLDFGPRSPWFEPQPGRCSLWPEQVTFHFYSS